MRRNCIMGENSLFAVTLYSSQCWSKLRKLITSHLRNVFEPILQVFLESKVFYIKIRLFECIV